MTKTSKSIRSLERRVLPAHRSITASLPDITADGDGSLPPSAEATERLAACANHDELFEKAYNAVTRARAGNEIEASGPVTSVAEFIDTAIGGLALWRWSGELENVTEMVMLWEAELADSEPHLLGNSDALVDLAVEIGVGRGSFFWEDINAELGAMPDNDLTTGNAELDAWFAAYGTAMS